MKHKERLLAIRLRTQGKSYIEIKNIVNVSKSTLSAWLKDVPLAEKHKQKLYVTRPQQNGYRLAKLRQQQRQERKNQVQSLAAEEFLKLRKNPLFLCGLMLYWAEGDKTERMVKFTNSDPTMIKFILKWFLTFCKVPREKVKIELHIHKLHIQKNTEKYWSKVTDLPTKQFQKTQIKPSSLNHRRKILYNGTCAVRIYDVALFWKIQEWVRIFALNSGQF